MTSSPDELPVLDEVTEAVAAAPDMARFGMQGRASARASRSRCTGEELLPNLDSLLADDGRQVLALLPFEGAGAEAASAAEDAGRLAGRSSRSRRGP